MKNCDYQEIIDMLASKNIQPYEFVIQYELNGIYANQNIDDDTIDRATSVVYQGFLGSEYTISELIQPIIEESDEFIKAIIGGMTGHYYALYIVSGRRYLSDYSK